MIGTVSLIIWALLIVVTAKYVLFLMQADNKGEGGILSLRRSPGPRSASGPASVFLLGVAGRVAVFGRRHHHAGDLGAFGARGPEAGQRRADAVTCCRRRVVILIVLFLAQSRGTAGVAAFFGPIMLVFFAVNARARHDADPARLGHPAAR